VKTTVTARNLELTDRLRGQIERKMRRLDRVAHPASEASVELIAHASRSTGEANVAEVTVVLNGSVLRSVSAGPTPLAAVDTVIDKLERQLVRTKERRRRTRARDADEATAILERVAAGSQAAEEATSPAVVRTKRFDMVPMFAEDAIARMEELGHAFFVFLSAETDGVCVVYRRRDGGYGLIEPVIGARGSGR
jgi:putative sigma-54 modulation protein